MNNRTSLPAVLVVAALSGVIVPAAPAEAGLAPFGLAGHAVRPDFVARTVDVTLTFTAAPDFAVADLPSNGLRNAFQIHLNAVHHPDGWHYASIVRVEPPVAQGLLVVRDDRPPDPSPDAGGWGPERGRVPYVLRGMTLSFTAPFAVLGDDDGRFTYEVFTTLDGATTDSVQGSTAVPLPPTVPLPPAAWPGLGTLAAVAWRRFGRAAAHRGE